MSENCSSGCGSCSTKCSTQDTNTNTVKADGQKTAPPRKPVAHKAPPKQGILPVNINSNIKRVIAVVSGKGGVGKSLTTSYLSVLMNRKGYNTAILDADITGPSIPKVFGLHEKSIGTEYGILPGVSKNGTKVMSLNLLLDTEDTPVAWRGPVIASTVKQFWSDVLWQDVDYMFVDMPPGTGDVALTVFQTLPVDGIIIVTSPQELVSMIVSKAVNLANLLNVPIIGMIENYSYISCGNCGEKISVFGESHTDEVAEKFGLKVLGKIPIDPAIAKACDDEAIESLQGDWLDEAAAVLETVPKKPIVEDEKK